MIKLTFWLIKRFTSKKYLTIKICLKLIRSTLLALINTSWFASLIRSIRYLNLYLQGEIGRTGWPGEIGSRGKQV